MIIAFTFILTSIFQFILYNKSTKKKDKPNELIISLIIVFTYIFIYPIIFYFIYKNDNHINFSFFTQAFTFGSIGTIFTTITYIFWRFEKRRNF